MGALSDLYYLSFYKNCNPDQFKANLGSDPTKRRFSNIEYNFFAVDSFWKD